jgi:hypothetical protein
MEFLLNNGQNKSHLIDGLDEGRHLEWKCYSEQEQS